MAKMYYEQDANLEVLKGKKIAVIGYGSQGHAQAQNLRDSGFDVIIAELKDTENYKKAVEDNWQVLSAVEAAKIADWIQILVPDEYQAKIWNDEIKPNIKDGAILGFSHGFNIRFKQIKPPKKCDVVLIAPKGPGHLVRRTYVEGVGTPNLIAIEQDYSGKAKDYALAYSKGIGGTRAGVIETTFTEETETDLFGEQVVLCGGVVELIKKGFEVLTEAGYQPEIAYFECLHEMKLIIDLIYEGGIGRMNYSISNTAEFGEYVVGNKIITERTKKVMQKVLKEIRSGKFARTWIKESQAGRPNFEKYRKNLSEHTIEKVGAQLRSMMPWLKKK